MNASDPLGCYLHSEDFIDYSYEDSFTSGSKEFVLFSIYSSAVRFQTRFWTR